MSNAGAKSNFLGNPTVHIEQKEDQLESYGMFHNLTPYTNDKS